LSQLQRQCDQSGWREYLDGRPVHCGTILEMWMCIDPDTTPCSYEWVAGRYEWTCLPKDRATFIYEDTDGLRKTVVIYSWLQFRWPAGAT